jgi:D-alanyl-D-alanine carboxypeptidase
VSRGGAIQRRLEGIVDAGLPGAFVYIEDRDGVSEFYTSGVSDLSTGAPVAPEMRYRIGSTTKTFTATVILQLVAEGELKLQAPVNELLAQFHIPNGRTITVEHLLRMRSGLPDFVDHRSLLSLDANLQPVSLQRAIELGISQPPLFAPGERFGYSNTNFCLLELIVEHVTGRGLAEELRARIFEPLGMSATSYPSEDDLTLPEPYIRGYNRDEAGWRECSRVFFGRGDGGVISTAPELARFFRALLLDRDMLSEELLRQMMCVVPDKPPAPEQYGLGLIEDPLPFGPVWGHGGGGFGYDNLPYLRIETGRFAVFMRNGSYGFRIRTDASAAAHTRFSPGFRAEVYR